MATRANPQPVNAKRFAGLFAGYDTGNAEEEEAISKARMLRSAAKASGLRIIDLLELPEVRDAIDVQMHPSRYENRLDVTEAQMTALREELTARTRDVRRLADQLKAERDKGEALRENLANAGLPAKFRRSPVRQRIAKSLGAPSWPFEIAVIAAALVLLLLATLHR